MKEQVYKSIFQIDCSHHNLFWQVSPYGHPLKTKKTPSLLKSFLKTKKSPPRIVSVSF